MMIMLILSAAKTILTMLMCDHDVLFYIYRHGGPPGKLQVQLGLKKEITLQPNNNEMQHKMKQFTFEKQNKLQFIWQLIWTPCMQWMFLAPNQVWKRRSQEMMSSDRT